MGGVRMPKFRYEIPSVKRVLEKSDISSLYHQGMSDREIGLSLGSNRDKVKYWRRARGLPVNHDNRLEKARREAISLYNTGLTFEEVREQVGFTRETIKKWIKSASKTA